MFKLDIKTEPATRNRGRIKYGSQQYKSVARAIRARRGAENHHVFSTLPAMAACAYL